MRELLDLRLRRDLPVLRQDLQADDPLDLLASLCLQDPPWRFGEEYPGDTPGPASARLSSPKLAATNAFIAVSVPAGSRTSARARLVSAGTPLI